MWHEPLLKYYPQHQYEGLGTGPDAEGMTDKPDTGDSAHTEMSGDGDWSPGDYTTVFMHSDSTSASGQTGADVAALM